MTKKLLEEIICKMEDNGFIIHGASFDCGNPTLIKDCGMSSRGNFSFPNPRDPNRNVYLFPGKFKKNISLIILSSLLFKIKGLENSNFHNFLPDLHNLIIRLCILNPCVFTSGKFM